MLTIGLEPTIKEETDFKSVVSTIPPSKPNKGGKSLTFSNFYEIIIEQICHLMESLCHELV